ncbi:MAG: glycosyltransferase family 87 protein [Acidobacteriaceae bacterium]
MGDTAVHTSTNRKPDFADLTMALACALAAASLVLALTLMPLIAHLAESRDFIVYWSTGQQLVHGGNPYNPAIMGSIEHSTGFTAKGSYYMRNPPWSLALVWPLGWLSARSAALPWSLLMLGLLVLSVRLLWTMFGRPGGHLAWLGYCFPPALICVFLGQTSLFLLLGLVLFLRLYKTHPFWAGTALWFCTLKPHLFLPFGIVLLVWIVLTRSYRIVFGTAAALAVSCVATQLIDPRAWSQYLHWASASGIAEESIPCLSVFLRKWIDPAAGWIAFVPAALGCAWALIYFLPRRHEWDWIEHGNLLVLVSLLVAPYCWLNDQSLALPALLYGATRTSSRTLLAVLAAMYILLEFEAFRFFWGPQVLYLWPAPAWLIWYLLARRSLRTADASGQTAPLFAATAR